MGTNILALPELSMPCAIESNQDWIDSIVFFDAAGNAVSLDGIRFHLQVRVSADLPDVLVDASTDNGLLQLLSSGFTCTLGAPGSGYQVGDRVFLGGGKAVAPAVITVTALKIVALGGLQNFPQGSSGSGGFTVGDLITLDVGVGHHFSASAAAIVQVDSVDGNGNILTYHVVNGGFYTVPSDFGYVAPMKAGASNQALWTSVSYGIAGISLTDPGIYTDQPPSPAPQGSTSGTGSGATFNLAQVNNALGILVPAGALVHPLIEAAGTYQIQAMADGYTQNVASGPMTVTQGIVR